MVTSSDIDALHTALDATPEDQGLRLALADVYDEAGDPDAAECMRWMAAKDRRPVRADGATEGLTYSREFPVWFFANPWADWPQRGAVLPEIMLRYFGQHTGEIEEGKMSWRKRRTAEEDLIACWRAMPLEARAECHSWVWPRGKS